MLEYPKTYEEAKIILKNSLHDDLHKHVMKKNILRGALVTAIAGGVAAGIGLIRGDVGATLAVLPIAVPASILGFAPVIVDMQVKAKVKDGSIFSGRTKQEVIDKAKKYVDTYNEFEAGKSK